MAGYLIALVGLFNVSNNMATKTYMESGTIDSSDVMNKLDEIKTLAQTSTDQASVNQLIQLLTNMNNGINEVKAMSTQVGQAVVNTQNLLRKS